MTKKKAVCKDNRLFRFGNFKEIVATISSVLGVLAVAFTVWFYFEKRFAPKDLTNEKIAKLELIQEKDGQRLDFKIWCDRDEENQKRIWAILQKYPAGSAMVPDLVKEELQMRLLKKDKINKILKYYEEKGFNLEGD